MTIEIKELVSSGSVLIDLTDAESSEVNGGAVGGAIGAGQALIRGQGMDRADKAGSVGQKIGAGIGAVGGAIGGGVIGTLTTGPLTLVTGPAAIGGGALGGAAVGASLSD